VDRESENDISSLSPPDETQIEAGKRRIKAFLTGYGIELKESVEF
jgi:hypothetical protein